MRRRWKGSPYVLAAALTAAIATACTPPPAAPALRPITLPDISSVAAPVQTQIRDQYASLQQHATAEAYGAMGRLFLATEFLDAADACFVDAATLDPRDIRWPYYLGHVERLRNQPSKAASYFERVLAAQPDHIPSLVWLGAMRLVEGQPDAAAPPLDRALALDAGDAAALYHAGRVALAKRDYRLAVERLNAAQARQPQATGIEYPLSLAYRGLGDVKDADAHLARRGTVDPSPSDPLMRQVAALLQNATAFEVRGADALAKRRWPEAAAALRQALDIAPGNAFTHLNLGTALFETGDAAGALAQFQDAVRLSPSLSKAHYGIGIVTEAAGRDGEAIAAFSAAVQHDADSMEARMSLADALRRNGRDAGALPQYAAIIKVNPSASPAHFGYAMALVHLKRYADARAALERATTTFAGQAGFAHALARLLAAAPEDSVRDGARALAITDALLKAQRTLELMQTRAMALAETGRFDEAAQWQRDAILAATQAQRADLMPRLSTNLARYENRQACRVPWADGDPVFKPRPGH